MEKHEETFWFITPVIGSIVTMLSYHNIPVDILYGFKVVFSLLMGIIGALLGEIVRQEVKKHYDRKKQRKWLIENKHRISQEDYKFFEDFIENKTK